MNFESVFLGDIPGRSRLYIPITRDNFQGYHQMLFDRALAELGR